MGANRVEIALSIKNSDHDFSAQRSPLAPARYSPRARLM
jgi:hypothetical protein